MLSVLLGSDEVEECLSFDSRISILDNGSASIGDSWLSTDSRDRLPSTDNDRLISVMALGDLPLMSARTGGARWTGDGLHSSMLLSDTTLPMGGTPELFFITDMSMEEARLFFFM